MPPFVQTALVADADAVVVPPGGMGSDMVDGTAVNANGERTVLSPGWQATWDEFHQQLGRRQVDVKPVISWTTGMFDFVDMPLEKLVAQLGRWYDVDFFFVNESIKGIRFTGAVKRSNTLKYMLDFVAMTSDVRYEVKGKTVCLYSMK